MTSPVDHLRLNAELMRLVRERATLQPGQALAQVRNASAIAATLQKLGVQAAVPAPAPTEHERRLQEGRASFAPRHGPAELQALADEFSKAYGDDTQGAYSAAKDAVLFAAGRLRTTNMHAALLPEHVGTDPQKMMAYVFDRAVPLLKAAGWPRAYSPEFSRALNQYGESLLDPAPLPGSGVSIYNSGSNPPEPRMDAEKNKLIARLLPVYARHGEALAKVREIEAGGGKPSGPQKASVTVTRSNVISELDRYTDYGRNPAGAPSIEELAQAYDAQVAAAQAEREELAGKPTMTLDELTAQATAALEQIAPREKYGTREATASTMLPGGSVITCAVADDRVRASRYNWHYEIKRTVRYTQDGKVISKDSLLKLIGGKQRQEINEALRSAFEAQAPSLEQEYFDYITRAFEYQQEKRDGVVPAYPAKDDRAREMILGTLTPHCQIVKIDPNGIRESSNLKLVLDTAKLREVAHKYGEDVAVQWFYKTNAKLGALESPELLHDRGGDVTVTGQRDGREVVMRQQRILKSSPNGVLFHQFPALLYVDGKFHTEAAYKKLFGDK